MFSQLLLLSIISNSWHIKYDKHCENIVFYNWGMLSITHKRKKWIYWLMDKWKALLWLYLLYLLVVLRSCFVKQYPYDNQCWFSKRNANSWAIYYFSCKSRLILSPENPQLETLVYGMFLAIHKQVLKTESALASSKP